MTRNHIDLGSQLALCVLILTCLLFAIVDFSGSGVVHLTGGTTALYATYILGSRRGRFYDATTGRPLEVPKPFPGHSVSLQMLGSFILWFGWFGFNRKI